MSIWKDHTIETLVRWGQQDIPMAVLFDDEATAPRRLPFRPCPNGHRGMRRIGGRRGLRRKSSIGDGESGNIWPATVVSLSSTPTESIERRAASGGLRGEPNVEVSKRFRPPRSV
jgi:hypothetical protein